MPAKRPRPPSELPSPGNAALGGAAITTLVALMLTAEAEERTWRAKAIFVGTMAAAGALSGVSLAIPRN